MELAFTANIFCIQKIPGTKKPTLEIRAIQFIQYLIQSDKFGICTKQKTNAEKSYEATWKQKEKQNQMEAVKAKNEL